ncbi:MAG: hypothetical protein HY553_21725 [Elusimicrobia bacterium]|nr:hypothetical protein [Elusimicrobiota bacterium]
MESLEPKPEKVRSGTFRVDRKEALRKLAAYRLADPAAFVLSWVRAGAESDATWIHVALDLKRIAVRFDGKAWASADLEDPYSAFFDEAAASPARHLVLGALAAFRLGARRAAVSSWGRGMALGPETVEPLEVPAGRTETALEAVWDGAIDDGARIRMFNLLSTSCGMLRAQLSISIMSGPDRTIPPLAAADDGSLVRFEEGGLRGLLQPPLNPDAMAGKAHLYTGGVRVSTVDWTFHPAQAEAHLDDPAFALDASQSGVIMDDRFTRALKAADAKVPRLLELAVNGHEHGYGQWTRFLFERAGLFSGLLGMLKLDRRRDADRVLAWLAGKQHEYERLIAWDTTTGAWLRSTAAALPLEEPQDPVLKKLYRAALYLSVNGVPLSIERLDEIAKFTTVLPVCRRLFTNMQLDPPVLWCPRPEDPAVRIRFHGRSRWFEDVSSFRSVGPFR